MHPQERQGGKSYCSGAVHVLKLDTSAKRKTARKVSGVFRVPFPTAGPVCSVTSPPASLPGDRFSLGRWRVSWMPIYFNVCLLKKKKERFLP